MRRRSAVTMARAGRASAGAAVVPAGDRVRFPVNPFQSGAHFQSPVGASLGPLLQESWCRHLRRKHSFTLPGDFDGDKAEAGLDGGVLALSLPKKANGSTRKIAIS